LPEAIREHFLWGARSIVIAGTHGKTTTTSLTGWVLTSAGADPTVLVGGIASNFGDGGSSYRMGRGRDFVIEGDEYDSAFFDKSAKFLKYLPDIAVINNIEFDHADIYADLDAVKLAFRRLSLLVPRTGLLLLGADSEHALALKAAAVSPVETYGFSESADWVAYELHAEDGRQRFAVPHGAWEQAFGYRFQTPDRTIVVSGDTGPASHIEEQCRRCDVLVHEVYSEAGFSKRTPEWQAYHARYHTSTRQLGAIATRAQPGLLVLYHQLIWSSTEDELVKEVRSAYDGKVVSAHDLDVF
jgi:hypothetical protein